jgi:putative Mg2+ transporter-C (MgtC) family protein
MIMTTWPPRDATATAPAARRIGAGQVPTGAARLGKRTMAPTRLVRCASIAPLPPRCTIFHKSEPPDMWESIKPWIGDIHPLLPSELVGPIVALAAILCGGLTGFERQRAAKPAGFRTMILICLGAAMFTQASVLLAGTAEHADRTRVAAQVVTGIGFLGAGAIIRERGQTIGITTAAGIWATAAVGLILGAGYIALGFFFTLLIVGTLSAARAIEAVVEGPCSHGELVLHYDAANGKTRLLIESVLRDHLHPFATRFETDAEGRPIARIQYCSVHRDHHAWIDDLLALPAILRVEQVG